MRRSLALLLVAGLFLLGALAGVAATHFFYARRLSQPGALADLALEVGARRLNHQLDLRPDQRQALDRVLDQTRGELADLRRDTVERLRGIRNRAAERFEPVLDEDQRAKLRRLMEDREGAFERYLR